jgi:hypothetical protein
MIPVNKHSSGRPKGKKTSLVGIGKFGVSLSAILYEKLGKPGYLETYVDGEDLVLLPREVDGPNHSKRYNIIGTDRAYYYNCAIAEFCLTGKYLFCVDKSGKLTVKSCVKVQVKDGDSSRKPGRPQKSIFGGSRSPAKGRTAKPRRVRGAIP